jgi:hexosaminidase
VGQHHGTTRLLGSLLLVATASAFSVASAPAAGAADATPLDQVVPAPASVTPGGPPYRITHDTHIRVDDSREARGIGAYLAELLRPSTGYRLPVTTHGRGGIQLRLAKGPFGAEGYRLDSGAKGVTITAAQPAGLFHGVQTLRQLLPAAVEKDTVQRGPWLVAGGTIRDTPRYGWRGAMLDVSRHFFTVDQLKRSIDQLALYKINKLHLHLSDDQGWRIEIKGWPRLTRYGGTSEVGNGPGGYYTQAQYSSIVRYAAKHFITVIPEVDTPSHTNAALASYAQLNCDGVAPPLYTGIEVGFSSLCIDKPVTYRFLDDVIGQLARLTPGPYLHIGGDEAHSTSRADYIRFVEKVEPIVRRHGKLMMGWAETSAAQLSGTGLAEYWNPASGTDPGTETATDAAAQGVKLVMAPASKTYLDMKYDELTPMGQDWAGLVEVSDSYDWDPVTYVSGIKESDVAGVEAPVWTETLKDLSDVEYMAFPRLPGVAEKGWSTANHSWAEYRTRLATQSARWEVMGVNYYCSPQVDWSYCRTSPVAPSQ